MIIIIIYVFKSDFGKILATGDFRYTPKIFKVNNNKLDNILIDKCYLDTI